MSAPTRLEQLLSIRKGLDFTQNRMANELGMSLRAYQAIEAGESACREIHVLAAERVAMINAVAKDDPMCAPAVVRAEALDLAALIREHEKAASA